MTTELTSHLQWELMLPSFLTFTLRDPDLGGTGGSPLPQALSGVCPEPFFLENFQSPTQRKETKYTHRGV